METVDSKHSETQNAGGATRQSRATMLGSIALGALFTAASASPVAAQVRNAAGVSQPVNDTDIVNFALNLEYLEAEFYNFAISGKTIEQLGVPVGGKGEKGPTTGGSKTQFNNRFTYGTALELASDEQNHVLLLRGLLGNDAVAKPAIDLGALGMTEKMTQFLVLARAFEDTGVSAYGGAAPLIQSKTVLGYAARILAVEAYHAGNIRLMTAQFGLQTKALDGQDVLPPPSGKKYFTDDNKGLAIVRTPEEVLAIVRPFFPNGLNGRIR